MHIPSITIKDHGRPHWIDTEALDLCIKKARLNKKYKASESPANYDRFLNVEKEEN